MKFTFSISWKDDGTYSYKREERVILWFNRDVEFNAWASPLSFTLILPLLVVFVDGRVLPWLPNKITGAVQENSCESIV